MTRKASKRKAAHAPHYSPVALLMASPTQPLPAAHALHLATKVFLALDDIERNTRPDKEAWLLLNDAMLVMHQLEKMGVIEDGQGLIEDARSAILDAGARYLDHAQPFSFTQQQAADVRTLLESWKECLAAVPERTMKLAHRRAEQYLAGVIAGKRTT